MPHIAFPNHFIRTLKEAPRFVAGASLLVALLFLTGCHLFPKLDRAGNALMIQELKARLDAREAAGLLEPENASVVFVHRHGTSFGNSLILKGSDETGQPLSAQDMIAACLAMTNSRALPPVKRCLRETYASAEPLRYSHTGLAYKLPGREWQVRQSLRAGDSGVHFQWYGTLDDFVDVSLIAPRIEVLIPTKEMQQNLARVLLIDGAGSLLIDPDYNLVAGPFQTQEQMSNQFILEIVAAALQDPSLPISRANSQAYLADSDYQPTILTLRGLRSLGKFDALFSTLHYDQQPYARRYETGEIITVTSVRAFLQDQGLITDIFEVGLGSVDVQKR